MFIPLQSQLHLDREEILINSEFAADALQEAGDLAEEYGVKELLPYVTSLITTA